jgi:Bifunctional DNA primase/polymerase, N-terminal
MYWRQPHAPQDRVQAPVAICGQSATSGLAPMHLRAPMLSRNTLPCFPCRKDKRPATPHGFKDATNDPDMVRGLWMCYPPPLIGVPTGNISGLDVLDIDPRKGGDQWFYGNHTRLPRTRTHQTASGGLQLIFQHATGLRCSSGTIATGIDVRSTGAMSFGGLLPDCQWFRMHR